MTHLYLSPHLDDAVLSCGGLIHQQARTGARVVVVTVCAGEPGPGPLSDFARSLHTRWGLTGADVVRARRAEDRAALDVLGAESVHLDFLDCIYRTLPRGGGHPYTSDAALFGDFHPAELPVVDELARALDALLGGEPDAQIYAPLGIGRHVDHQLTRLAAERLGRALVYYEDYPYAVREPWTDSWGGLAARLSPSYVAITPGDLDAYCRSIASYRSQISSFWTDEAAMRQAITQFTLEPGTGGHRLRLWHKP
jgi:LmbE family N-acetylglucosaminyl deacetylase